MGPGKQLYLRYGMHKVAMAASRPKTLTDQDSLELIFGLRVSIQPIEVSNQDIEDHE